MTTRRYGTPTKTAKQAADEVIGKSRRARKSSDEVVGKSRRSQRSPLVPVAQALWPVKTAYWWAQYADVDHRRAEDWLSGKGWPSAEAQDEMLRGEHGFEFLKAIMGFARTAWWRRFNRQVEIAQNRSALEEARRRLEALERGEE